MWSRLRTNDVHSNKGRQHSTIDPPADLSNERARWLAERGLHTQKALGFCKAFCSGEQSCFCQKSSSDLVGNRQARTPTLFFSLLDDDAELKNNEWWKHAPQKNKSGHYLGLLAPGYLQNQQEFNAMYRVSQNSPTILKQWFSVNTEYF